MQKKNLKNQEKNVHSGKIYKKLQAHDTDDTVEFFVQFRECMSEIYVVTPDNDCVENVIKVRNKLAHSNFIVQLARFFGSNIEYENNLIDVGEIELRNKKKCVMINISPKNDRINKNELGDFLRLHAALRSERNNSNHASIKEPRFSAQDIKIVIENYLSMARKLINY